MKDEPDPDVPDPDEPRPEGEPQFVVGPTEPVTDSRQLPAVDAGGEDPFVTGADLEDIHPDNSELDANEDVDNQLDVDDADEPPPDDVEPSEGDLDADVEGVDPDDVDDVGFDENDDVDTDPADPGVSPPVAGGS
jgi:hypothetical protein